MEGIIALFTNHSIETEVSDGRVYAKEWYTFNGTPGFEWVDITEWTIEDANIWLGY